MQCSTVDCAARFTATQSSYSQSCWKFCYYVTSSSVMIAFYFCSFFHFLCVIVFSLYFALYISLLLVLCFSCLSSSLELVRVCSFFDFFPLFLLLFLLFCVLHFWIETSFWCISVYMHLSLH